MTCALFCLAAIAPAAETTPTPASTAFDNTRDLEIQVRAARSSTKIRELSPFNLGVKVQNGVAVVWGPVSSPELRDKALKKIENVRGVFKVRSELFVSSRAGLPSEPLVPALPDALEQSSSALPDRRTGTLPPLPGKLTAKQLDDLIGSSKRVSLMSPIEVLDESTDLTSTLEQIRTKDARFRSVRYEMKNGCDLCPRQQGGECDGFCPGDREGARR